MSLTQVYTQLGILFTLMFLGYILGRINIIKEEGISAFTGFIVKIAMPALIIDGMMIELTKEKMTQSVMIIGISILVYSITYIFAVFLPRWLEKDEAKRGIYSFAIMFSNVGFMGFPVLKAIFGEEAIFIAAIYNVLFHILVYTLGIRLIKGKKDKKEVFSYKMLINPGTVASLLGLGLFYARIKLPGFLAGSIEAVGGLCTPLSMIVIGAMLSTLPLKEIGNNIKLYVLAVIRLIILPLMVLVLLKWILKVQDPLLLGVPVVVAGMPVAANAAMMVREYGNEASLASQAIMVTTLLSGITIPLLALFF